MFIAEVYVPNKNIANVTACSLAGNADFCFEEGTTTTG